MPMILVKTYTAFKAAGVSEEAAQAAAEEIGGYDNRFSSIEKGLAAIEGKLALVLVVMGIQATLAIATIGMLWQLAATVTQLSGIVGGLRP